MILTDHGHCLSKMFKKLRQGRLRTRRDGRLKTRREGRLKTRRDWRLKTRRREDWSPEVESLEGKEEAVLQEGDAPW